MAESAQLLVISLGKPDQHKTIGTVVKWVSPFLRDDSTKPTVVRYNRSKFNIYIWCPYETGQLS